MIERLDELERVIELYQDALFRFAFFRTGFPRRIRRISYRMCFSKWLTAVATLRMSGI